jgi:DME family drug/metabolite transporter
VGTGGLAVQLVREAEPMSPVTISAWRMALAAVVLHRAWRHGYLLDPRPLT